MIKELFTLFKIARSLASVKYFRILFINFINHQLLKLFLKFFSISFKKKMSNQDNINDDERLCKSIQSMRTSFIKLD